MQFAYMQLFKGKNFLVDARELKYIDQILDAEDREKASIASDTQPSDDDKDYKFALVYGCYLPQADCNFPTNEKIRQINDAVGYAMVCVQDAVIKYLSIEAVKVFDNPLLSNCGHKRGGLHHSQNVAFAALVKIPLDMDVGDMSTQAVSAFLRYKEQMDLMTNVLNRMGIFALKAEEKRIPKNTVLDTDTWTNFIDQKRAIKSAIASV